MALVIHAAVNAAVGEGAEPQKPSVRIVAFGDSTTFGYALRDGYPRQLAAALHVAGWPVTVINSGINGDTTQGARERFARDVTKHAPDIVLIQFGLNDQTVRLYQPPDEVPSYLSEAQFIENLRYFVSELKGRGARPVLMTSNLMFWSPTLERHYPAGPYLDGPRGGNRVLEQYMDAERALAAEEGVPLVDVCAEYSKRSQDVNSPPPGLMMEDGVHPTAEGYAGNVELVVPQLLPMIDTMGAKLDPWRDEYFVVREGRPVCAYISGRGGRDGDGFYELSRVVHERNPRDAISAPVAMKKRDGWAHIELTAGEHTEWELMLDAARTIRFSAVTGAIRLVEQQQAGDPPMEQPLAGPKIASGPIAVEIVREGAQVRVEVGDQAVLSFDAPEAGVGPLELAVTAGAFRLKTFKIH
jgi:acyl-CoA thioesterase-1